jgi:hypothetical protein
MNTTPSPARADWLLLTAALRGVLAGAARAIVTFLLEEHIH